MRGQNSQKGDYIMIMGFDQDTLEKILAMYNAGRSCKELGRIFHRDPGHIAYLIRVYSDLLEDD